MGRIDQAAARARMVAEHLRGRGIGDERVLRAMGEVPRERFVRPEDEGRAYADRALPIGHDQTISQPYVVALMLEALALRPEDRLLEIGAGSGYAVAVAARLCASVLGIERVEPLAVAAARRLEELGVANAVIRAGDGSLGAPDEAPFDAILVSAGAPAVAPALLEQLADGGRYVAPIGRSSWAQELVRYTRDGEEYRRTALGGVAFVPLIGAGGW